MLQEEVRVKRKNQITWPEKVADQMEVREGSRLLVVYDEKRQVAVVRRIRDSYAGALRGVYGGDGEEIRTYLEEERGSWATSWTE